MPDPHYTDRQLDDMRKDFRAAERSPTETYMPVKQKAGQVADMLDDLATRRSNDGEK